MNGRGVWHLDAEREPGDGALLLHLSSADASGDELHEEAHDDEEAVRLLSALEPNWVTVPDEQTEYGNQIPQPSPDAIARWGIEEVRSGKRVRFHFENRSYEDIRAAVQDWRDATRPPGGAGSSE